jgi:2'-5' RNA ligase
MCYHEHMYKFSIVSYFPKEIAKEITEIQKELTDITGSKGALGELEILATFFEEDVTNSYAVWYQQPLPYNPHITVAYKDLTEDGYEKAKEHLSKKTFEREIEIDNVCLAIQNEKGEWREYKRFSLKT